MQTIKIIDLAIGDLITLDSGKWLVGDREVFRDEPSAILYFYWGGRIDCERITGETIEAIALEKAYPCNPENLGAQLARLQQSKERIKSLKESLHAEEQLRAYTGWVALNLWLDTVPEVEVVISGDRAYKRGCYGDSTDNSPLEKMWESQDIQPVPIARIK